MSSVLATMLRRPWAWSFVTNAWSGWVRIGSRMPTWPASRVTRPPVAERTTPAEIGPADVSTPVTRSPWTVRALTGVCWKMSTPRWDAPAA